MTENEIWNKAYDKLIELYGDTPDLQVVSRFYSEKQALESFGAASYFDALASLRKKAKREGNRWIVKNEIASCLIAFLLGTTDENPLPAHYYCPRCKMALWMVEKDVFDLREGICFCGERMKVDGFDLPFETYLPYAGRRKTVDAAIACSDAVLLHLQPSLLDATRMCAALERETGVCVDAVDLNDSKVKQCLLSGNFARTASNDGEALKQMITLTKPQSYYELFKLIGLSHGTNTWKYNAERLFAMGACTPRDLPSTRDEVFMTIRDAMRKQGFYDAGFALEVTRKASRSYYLYQGMDRYTSDTLRALGFDDWFIRFLSRTYYLSTKGIAVMDLKYSILLTWYLVYYPKEYQRIAAKYNF